MTNMTNLYIPNVQPKEEINVRLTILSQAIKNTTDDNKEDEKTQLLMDRVAVLEEGLIEMKCLFHTFKLGKPRASYTRVCNYTQEKLQCMENNPQYFYFAVLVKDTDEQTYVCDTGLDGKEQAIYYFKETIPSLNQNFLHLARMLATKPILTKFLNSGMLSSGFSFEPKAYDIELCVAVPLMTSGTDSESVYNWPKLKGSMLCYIPVKDFSGHESGKCEKKMRKRLSSI